MARLLRYVRIAFTTACLIACGLLLALLVRSNRSADVVGGKFLIPYEIVSVRGRLKLTRTGNQSMPTTAPYVRSYPIGEGPAETIENHVLHYSNRRGFGFYDRHSLMLPHWFAVLCAAIFAGIPWFRFRFSLRTLLIATALIAAALGTITIIT